MYLNASTDSIEIILGGTVTANQLQWNVSWQDITSSGMTLPQSAGAGLTNNATLVTMVAAPAASTTRQVTNINVYNADTATATVIVRKDVSATKYVLVQYALVSLDTLMWSRESGWQVVSGGSGAITALTGDVTASGPGSAAATIASNAVTFAKMQNIATTQLLGRASAGTGNVEQVTVGGGIEFSGTGIRTSAFTGDVTKAAGGTALTIASQAVTYAQMQNVSAASRLLGRGSAAGAGSPQEITLGTGLSMSGTTLNASAASYTFSTGLTESSGTVTNNLSTGVAGGQSVVGGTAASNNLTLSSTSNATKGKILFGTSAYDEVNNRLGIGTASPATPLHIVGRFTVSQDTTVATQTSAVITTDTANCSIVLRPTGTGAIIANAPDGTATGGNARGIFATDLQKVRATNAQVASGARSFIGTGSSNSASSSDSAIIAGQVNSANTGNYATVINGERNEAVVSYGTILNGGNNRAYLFGQTVLAGLSSAFSATAGNGSMQSSTLIYSKSIQAQAIQELFLDSISIKAILALPTGAIAGRAWRARIDLVAIVQTAGTGTLVLGECFMGSYLVGIKRIGNTTSLVGTVNVQNEVSDTNMATSVVTIDADDTNEALRIQFTPPTGGTSSATSVIRVVATAYLTEVGY